MGQQFWFMHFYAEVGQEIFIDRVAGEIIRLVASVCVSVRLSVGALLFEPFDLAFWHDGQP